MIYECRLNRVTRQHVYAGLLAIGGIYLLSLLGYRGSEYWWASSVGIALALGASYLIGNTRVRIEENGETVTVEHSGMVHANIPIDSIANVSMSGIGNMARIVAVTNDGMKYFIPVGCFSGSEVEELIKVLGKA
jgi:hypothetical protein